MNNPLWDFSLRTYARPSVAELCLAAQDEYGVDVNLLLYAAWLAADERPLAADYLAALERDIAPWRRDVVVPLRTLRRQWRAVAGIEELREALKVIELRAERAQQDRIWRHHQRRPPVQGRADLCGNLRAVFAVAGASPAAAGAAVERLAAALRP